MKAAQINQYGGPDIISVVDIPTPELRPDQLLIEVHASSINPFDSKIRSGAMQEMIPLTFPVTLGGDIAGIVTQVGSDVAGFAIGDKVYGQANAVAGNSGAFAEYAATVASQVAKAPQNLDFVSAASLPLVGVSALQALTEHISLKAGQKILITGGAGGIGMIAIQIAKHLGATVAATATGDDIDLVKKLGADTVVDYKTDTIASISDYDAVFDTVGDDFNATLHTLKPGGVAVTMAAAADESLAKELHVTALSQMTHVTTTSLDKLRELIESDAITPQIGKVFSLDQITDAFKAKEEDHIPGKIALTIQ